MTPRALMLRMVRMLLLWLQKPMAQYVVLAKSAANEKFNFTGG